jgi:hypothetical protein
VARGPLLIGIPRFRRAAPRKAGILKYYTPFSAEDLRKKRTRNLFEQKVTSSNACLQQVTFHDDTRGRNIMTNTPRFCTAIAANNTTFPTYKQNNYLHTASRVQLSQQLDCICYKSSKNGLYSLYTGPFVQLAAEGLHKFKELGPFIVSMKFLLQCRGKKRSLYGSGKMVFIFFQVKALPEGKQGRNFWNAGRRQ